MQLVLKELREATASEFRIQRPTLAILRKIQLINHNEMANENKSKGMEEKIGYLIEITNRKKYSLNHRNARRRKWEKDKIKCGRNNSLELSPVIGFCTISKGTKSIKV